MELFLGGAGQGGDENMAVKKQLVYGFINIAKATAFQHLLPKLSFVKTTTYSNAKVIS